MQLRYGALGFVAVLYQIAGVLIFIGTVVFWIGSLGSANPLYPSVTVVAGVISGIGVYAFGDLINLFRDMELNSRIAAHHAEEQAEYARRTANALERLVGRRRQTAGGSTQSTQPNIPAPPPNPQ